MATTSNKYQGLMEEGYTANALAAAKAGYGSPVANRMTVGDTNAWSFADILGGDLGLDGSVDSEGESNPDTYTEAEKGAAGYTFQDFVDVTKGTISTISNGLQIAGAAADPFGALMGVLGLVDDFAQYAGATNTVAGNSLLGNFADLTGMTNMTPSANVTAWDALASIPDQIAMTGGINPGLYDEAKASQTGQLLNGSPYEDTSQFYDSSSVAQAIADAVAALNNDGNNTSYGGDEGNDGSTEDSGNASYGGDEGNDGSNW